MRTCRAGVKYHLWQLVCNLHNNTVVYNPYLGVETTLPESASPYFVAPVRIIESVTRYTLLPLKVNANLPPVDIPADGPHRIVYQCRRSCLLRVQYALSLAGPRVRYIGDIRPAPVAIPFECVTPAADPGIKQPISMMDIASEDESALSASRQGKCSDCENVTTACVLEPSSCAIIKS
ncbi:hypothetical protein KM043_000109 [Ampulex compressa]|nr:hypothetical protein KM043_000109 [Ampulex compressa]